MSKPFCMKLSMLCMRVPEEHKRFCHRVSLPRPRPSCWRASCAGEMLWRLSYRTNRGGRVARAKYCNNSLS